MMLTHTRRNVPVETALHPLVYAGATALLVWTVAVAWIAFGAASYLALQLAIITFLAVMFALVPFWLSRIAKAAIPQAKQGPWREWANHEFMTASGPVEAKHAAIMVLLAPAAVALGITATLAIAKLAALGILAIPA